MRGDVARVRMAKRDRRVGVSGFLNQNGGHRFADDVPAAQDDDFHPFDFHLRPEEQLLHACRCAGDKTGGVAEHQLADVDRVETVHVLLRQDRRVHIGLIEMTRQRRLHQNAMDLQVGIELRDEFQQISFRSGLGQEVRDRSDGETGAHPLLHAHVNLRSGIIADPNESQARLHTALLQKRNALGGLGVNLFGNGTPVNEIGHRHQGTT